MNGVITKSKQVLEKPTYLLDQNVFSYYGTKPECLFLDIIDVLPIDSSDDEILDYSIKNNLIIVTRDSRFALDILLQSRDVIFQTRYNKRFYLKTIESKLLSANKKGTIQKILYAVSNKKSYVAETDYLSTKLRDYDVSSPIAKISNLNNVSADTRLKIILEYARKTKSVFVTSYFVNCIKALFDLEECVFVDDKQNLNYLSVEYYEFDTVRYDRNRLVIKNRDYKILDPLQENIRLARKSIDEVCKNLNFIECELVRRKRLEASEETTSDPLSGYQKEANHE